MDRILPWIKTLTVGMVWTFLRYGETKNRLVAPIAYYSFYILGAAKQRGVSGD